jgi:hypothetical protein
VLTTTQRHCEGLTIRWVSVVSVTVVNDLLVHICAFCAVRWLPCLWCNSPTPARDALFLRFRDHTQWRTTVGRTPLDEGSVRHTDLYLTTHNIHNRQTSILQRDSNPRSSKRASLTPLGQLVFTTCILNCDLRTFALFSQNFRCKDYLMVDRHGRAV